MTFGTLKYCITAEQQFQKKIHNSFTHNNRLDLAKVRKLQKKVGTGTYHKLTDSNHKSVDCCKW